MTSSENRRLTVSVLTYRRPKDIAEVVPMLAEQCRSVEALGYAARLLVIDNDPAGSARATVEGAAGGLDVPRGVHYVNEQTPGISAARNRALRECAEEDLMVFIDDDERPSRDWLRLLVQTYERHRPAAVVGPVISRFEVEPDAWVSAGRYFDRRRLPTGTPVDVAATNNLLLDMDVVRRVGLTFHPGFGFVGGEDTMFTRQLHRDGGELIWCDEAVVVDVVPAERVTRRWVVLRALSSGNSWSLTSIELSGRGLPRLGLRAALSYRGLVRVAGGAARVVQGALSRRTAYRARGVRTLARGVGMTMGAWGAAYQEYRRRD